MGKIAYVYLLNHEHFKYTTIVIIVKDYMVNTWQFFYKRIQHTTTTATKHTTV